MVLGGWGNRFREHQHRHGLRREAGNATGCGRGRRPYLLKAGPESRNTTTGSRNWRCRPWGCQHGQDLRNNGEAYPDWEQAVRDREGRDVFLQAVTPPDLQQQLLLREPGTLQQAITENRRLEQILSRNQAPSRVRSAVGPTELPEGPRPEVPSRARRPGCGQETVLGMRSARPLKSPMSPISPEGGPSIKRHRPYLGRLPPWWDSKSSMWSWGTTQPEGHGGEANTDAARPDGSPEGNRTPVETGEGWSRPPGGRRREPRRRPPRVMQDNTKDGCGKGGSSEAQRNPYSPNQDRHSTGQLSSEAAPHYPGSPVSGDLTVVSRRSQLVRRAPKWLQE
ncbi:hypothetical protein EOD39_10075 [Acipenser ruthenus]|uniref:Uncharacterized protein n=1 Tax=Acipenser ruthenus TaxID=7906 RepID=A0A444TYN5_ACIRT|nr:hypothetical protein EOD39_10075 [Acipenser ruthenus]